MNNRQLIDKVHAYCQELEAEFDLISATRKDHLLNLSNYIEEKIAAEQTSRLVVICTHNSRRSHIGQLWLAVGADYYQLPEIHTYSGGTEATAFNIRAVDGFRRIGFDIVSVTEGTDNPVYQVKWRHDGKTYNAFSKKYGDDPNPSEGFASIMVCTDADEGCPVVRGCDFRISLPYEDPKAYDDTDLEAAKYGERIRQIGREMLFVLANVENQNT